MPPEVTVIRDPARLSTLAGEWDEREDYPPDLLAEAARVGLTSYAIPAT